MSACVFAASSIIIGAIGAHLLKDKISINDLATLDIASQYLYFVSIPVLVLILTNNQYHWPRSLILMFICSGCLFSGSLILYLITKAIWLVKLTPIGGLLMIVSWITLAIVGSRKI